MGGKKQRDPGRAIVEIRAETDELKNLSIAKPIKADPSGAGSTPNSKTRHFARDPVSWAARLYLSHENMGLG